MTNKFDNLDQHRAAAASATNKVSHRETSMAGKPTQKRVGRDVFDTLMKLTAEDHESPMTPYGVLIANSTKRNLRKQIGELFLP